jgi:hypothetical protein
MGARIDVLRLAIAALLILGGAVFTVGALREFDATRLDRPGAASGIAPPDTPSGGGETVGGLRLRSPGVILVTAALSVLLGAALLTAHERFLPLVALGVAIFALGFAVFDLREVARLAQADPFDVRGLAWTVAAAHLGAAALAALLVARRGRPVPAR